MRFETKEYQIWYTNGLGTSCMRVRATSTFEAIKEAEKILGEHEDILSIEEL